MDIWEIRLNSDECQYCESPLHPDAIYTCKYPGKSYNKECEEGICPVAVPTQQCSGQETPVCNCIEFGNNRCCPVHGGINSCR